MNMTDIPTRLADILGIDWRARHLTGFVLEVKAGQIPTVDVTYEIGGKDYARLQQVTERFTLQNTFDAKRMEFEALERLKIALDDAVQSAALHSRLETSTALRLSDYRHDSYLTEREESMRKFYAQWPRPFAAKYKAWSKSRGKLYGYA